MSENPSISKVVKAINSPQRREILRILSLYKRPFTFTELMNEIMKKSGTSSQFSYHMKILVEAKLILKVEEEGYKLTQLGNRTGLLLELSQEDESSALFSSLYLAFSNLNPLDCLIALFIIPFLMIFGAGISIHDNLLMVFLGCIGIIGIYVYLYLKLRSFIALFFFNTFLWGFFVRGKEYLVPLYFLFLFTFIPITGEDSQILPNPFNIVMSVLSGLLCIFLMVSYYWKYSK
ncbi:MAG: ArsR/SmtB family transcription factor [Candidatus Hodarchaeota archaeon]